MKQFVEVDAEHRQAVEHAILADFTFAMQRLDHTAVLFDRSRSKRIKQAYVKVNGYRVTVKAIFGPEGYVKRRLWRIEFPKPGVGCAETNSDERIREWAKVRTERRQ